MKAYRLTSTAHSPRLVFANTEDEAAQIAVLWYCLNGFEAAQFALDGGWAKKLVEPQRQELKTALRWGVSGINSPSPDGTWGIQQPRDEREDDW